MEPHRVAATKRGAAAPAFTLVEVMLAIALLSIIVTVMYSVFHTMGRIVRRSERTKEAYQTARLILSRMRQDLSCAHYSPQGKNFIFRGENIPGHDGDADAVSFVTSAHVISGRDRPEGDLAEVSYYLDERNPGILVRREDVSPDDELETGGVLHILGKNVVGLNFSYLDGREEATQQTSRGATTATLEAGQDETQAERKAWKEEWDSEDTTYLPRAVRIDLAIQNKEGEIEDFSTTVVLAMGRTETSILPTVQQALGATQRGRMPGPTQLGPGGPPGGRRGGQGEGQFGPGGRPGGRRGGQGEGTRDFGPGQRGGEGSGQTGRGMRSPGRGSGTSSTGAPSIRRTTTNAGSGTRPPTPGGGR